MSYEGFSQFLCKNGHQWTLDCYEADREQNYCPHCKTVAIWENMVDVTNGSYDDDGIRIDGFIELELVEYRKCDKCQSTLEIKYKLPKEGGRKI